MPNTPKDNVSIQVMINGAGKIVVTPQSINLGQNFPSTTTAMFTQPCSLTFDLEWANSTGLKPPYRFLTVTEDPELGIDIAVDSTEPGSPAVSTEFTFSPNGTTTVIVTDANTGGGLYDFLVKVADKDGTVTEMDPSIRNRGG